MTQVITISATTAAYAAQAVKPSARISGDGPTDEAITLLSARPKEDAASSRLTIAGLRGASSLSMMLMSSKGGQPQGTRSDVIRRYREFEPDIPEDEDLEDASAQDDEEIRR